nr:MAG TPA: hypothetical protein [Caudoviricetes sp.]
MSIKSLFTTAVSRVKFRSPEILIGAGVVGLISSAVLAVRRGVRWHQAASNMLKSEHEAIKKATEVCSNEDYPVEDRAKDYGKLIGNGVWSFTQIYGPSVLIGAASVGSILWGTGILKGRLAAMTSAAATAQAALEKYRSKVREKFGDDADGEFALGVKAKKLKIKDEDGNKSTHTKYFQVGDGEWMAASPYARIWDESALEWSRNRDIQYLTLRSLENHFNRELDSRGVVFLNDVYKALGLPLSKDAALVGWIKDYTTPRMAKLAAELGRTPGDGLISFGVFEGESPSARAFLSGHDDAVVLDFNVDGPVYDLIPAL